MQIGKNRNCGDGGRQEYALYWIILALILLGLIAAIPAKANPACPVLQLQNGEGQDRNCTHFHIAMTPKGRTIELRRNGEWVKVEDVDCSKATFRYPEKQRYYEAESIAARFWCPEAVDYTHQARQTPLNRSNP